MSASFGAAILDLGAEREFKLNLERMHPFPQITSFNASHLNVYSGEIKSCRLRQFINIPEEANMITSFAC
ncbi:MAG TPA: hypothetical protein VIL78_02920 [Hanamia sp.]